MEEFYLVLASNGGTNMFPKNCANHFYNSLAHPLHLDGKWRVSLQEISYINSMDTITDEEIAITIEGEPTLHLTRIDHIDESKKRSIYVEMKQLTGEIIWRVTINLSELKKNDFHFPLRLKMVDKTNKRDVLEYDINKGEMAIDVMELKEGHQYVLMGYKKRYPPPMREIKPIKAGYYYTAEELCDEMNRVLDGKAAFEVEMVGKDKFFKIAVKAKVELEMRNGLHYILGFKKLILKGKMKADVKSDLIRGSFAMFIYCDIVDNIMVGDEETPLLRTVHLPTTKRGETVNQSFKSGYYMQLTKSYMNYIEVDVRSDSGEPFPFSKHVKMLLTLHFKRDKNSGGLGHRSTGQWPVGPAIYGCGGPCDVLLHHSVII